MTDQAHGQSATSADPADVEALKWVRGELFSLCEATEEACAQSAAYREGKPGAFARGRVHEAKGIRRAMGEVIAERLRTTRPSLPAPGREVKPLDWQETFTDRGDGSEDQTGWEADSGFGAWYAINQYFGSDSYGWEVQFDFDVIADCDDPDKAKAAAQADYEKRISAALSRPPENVDHRATLSPSSTAGDSDKHDIVRPVQSWEVEVRLNGQSALTIGHNHLAGIENISDFETEVENCAQHLLAFLGRGCPGNGDSARLRSAGRSDKLSNETVARALKAFQEAANSMVMCQRCNGTGYHHGFGEHGHDPDWCVVCGGCQSVAEFDDEGAMRKALEAVGACSIPVVSDKASLERVFDRLGTRLNNVLCEMKPDHDDSIVGFNEAWDVMRAIFKEELERQ